MRIQIIFLSILLSGFISDKKVQKSEFAVSDNITAINNLIDHWHKSAANANFDAFFGCMDKDAYYIGTDESEKWSRQEFMAYCKPYFDKGTAWDFKPFDREIYFNDDENFAWFDEKLETWMGICRGSGVVIKTTNGWKIKHYHLSVTVPNDIVRDFIQMVDQYKAKQAK